ncbi:MAG: hypothetical protein COV29_04165 [Candidatus Yanofskybacteria bacterium CG10_big_fil_rev_8_21_14_0_10_36_16]|uniref:Uncharacterized protein n=1 Tax=Candidatus Yanofskybacteria bacterium CG10_big_fil_rev_8_21_14_0_10_36_16 TaxID=1975096 RepID=A0A2J0Q6G0_9BACT|nr:MAG: hypothetical protein COV29_04165 [Candidatus Yanofskybacteria bacterium CG10_big_fil_rev_8_21_14_0_10_36_16]
MGDELKKLENEDNEEETTDEDSEEADLVAAQTKKTTSDNEEGTLTVDVLRTSDDVYIKSAIAGVTAKDLDITINNDMVTIKGNRKQDETLKTASYDWRELYWGPFSRTVILPEEIDVDSSKASIKNGVLTIKLPKVSKNKTKKI